MALHPTIVAGFPAHIIEYRHDLCDVPARNHHDLAPLFWRIAIPACLLFWAAVAYGIHSIT